MKNWLKPIIFGIFMAVVAHLVAIAMIPSLIMDIALKRIAETAGGVNKLYHGEMVTPQNQRIVRSSPDLAYSTCVLDLSDGPVEVFIGKGADYASAAFYGANTDNVHALNDRKIGPQGARLMIVSARTPIAARPGTEVISLPSDRGLMLIRRLAPTAAAYARVVNERAGDSCAQLPKS
jgi:uncharacterized membrane protein